MVQKIRPQAATLYGLPQPVNNVNPVPIKANRAPLTTDTGYDLGQVWIDKIGGDAFTLTQVAAGVANWVISGASSGPLNTLTGDSGGAISPVAGNINLFGTGSQITTTGAGADITFSIPAAFVAPGSIASTTGLQAGTTLTSAGATTLATTGASINTFGNATGATSITITSGSGGTSLVSTNSTMALASGTGAMNISADATANAVNVGTGAGAKTVTIGSTNTTSTTTVQSGTGALNVTATNGALTIISGTGALAISNDAAATTVTIGTGAAAKTVTLGSTNTTSATTVNYGTGNLVIDGAATGTVTIAPAITSGTFNLGGTGANTGTATIFGGTGAQTINVANSTGGKTLNIATGAGANAVVLGSTNTTSATTINSGTGNLTLVGSVVQTTNPCFLEFLGATAVNVTGDGTSYTLGTDALTEVFDRGSNATTAGVFTAPVTGIYDLRAQVAFTGATIATTFVLNIVTTLATYTKTFIKAAGAQDETIDISVLANMTATNTATVTMVVSGEAAATVDVLGGATRTTYFCGRLVG